MQSGHSTNGIQNVRSAALELTSQLPKFTEYMLTASEDATDKATLVADGDDKGKIIASDTFNVKFTATGSTGAYPASIPADQIQIKDANGMILANSVISAAATGAAVGNVFTSVVTAGSDAVASADMSLA